MAKETEVKPEVESKAMVPSDFARKYAGFAPQLGQFIKDVRSVHSQLVNMNNDLDAKRRELLAVRAEVERVKQEKQIHLDAFSASQRNLIDKLTKERHELNEARRRFEVEKAEIERRFMSKVG